MNAQQAINRIKRMKNEDLVWLSASSGVPFSTINKIKCRVTLAPRKATMDRLIEAIATHV